MRLISSLVLLVYFSPAFSTPLESAPESEQGEASTTSAPSNVIPEQPDWGKGFLPPLSNLEASTTSAKANLAPEESESEEGQASPSIKPPESEWGKGFLPPQSNSGASTTSANSNAAPEVSSIDLLLEKSFSTNLETDSTLETEENTSEMNENGAEETSVKPQHHTTSKIPHQIHKHKTTAKSTPPPVPVTVTPITDRPTRHHPCRCADGVCACCTGAILESLHIPVHRRACANIEYEPDEFAFRLKLFWNDKLLLSERMSAKNPRPVCIPINRYFGVSMCAKLSNIYFSGRNMHACLDLEGTWDKEVAFHFPFNCFRIGQSGVAVLQPEDGGGLPPPPDEEEQVDEDYDDSARGWRSNKVHVIRI